MVFVQKDCDNGMLIIQNLKEKYVENICLNFFLNIVLKLQHSNANLFIIFNTYSKICHGDLYLWA